MKGHIELELQGFTPDFVARKHIDEKTGEERVEAGEELVVVTFAPVALSRPAFKELLEASKGWRILCEITKG